MSLCMTVTYTLLMLYEKMSVGILMLLGKLSLEFWQIPETFDHPHLALGKPA